MFNLMPYFVSERSPSAECQTSCRSRGTECKFSLVIKWINQSNQIIDRSISRQSIDKSINQPHVSYIKSVSWKFVIYNACCSLGRHWKNCKISIKYRSNIFANKNMIGHILLIIDILSIFYNCLKRKMRFPEINF